MIFIFKFDNLSPNIPSEKFLTLDLLQKTFHAKEELL